MTNRRRYFIKPIVHPAAVLRGAFELDPVQPVYLRRVFDTVRSGNYQPPPDVNQPPPGTKLYPTLSDIEQCVAESRLLGAVSIDIENCGRWLICVGLTPLALDRDLLGPTRCVRFRLRGGSQFWSSNDDLYRVIDLFDELLGDPAVTKVFHNAGHDVVALEDHGWTVNGRIIDTMLLAHTANTELPKGLQFTATLYLDAPAWKQLTSPDDEDEGKA